MHLGKSYKLSEFLVWTRRQIYWLLLCGSVPVVLYKTLGLTWLSVPLSVIVLLGTATSFIVGFKNVQTYNRAMEAQHIWTSILGTSRLWGVIARDFPADAEVSKELVYRHLAWLTALRYELRQPRVWESTDKPFNAEYRRFYVIPEREIGIHDLLPSYLPPAETKQVLSSTSRPTKVLSLQGAAISRLLASGKISVSFYMELERTLRELIDQQASAERLKNFPYPRQYATINMLFVRCFCLLFPFGLLQEFNKLNDGVTGFMHGNMIWLVVPFSVIVSWMYTSLEQVGESTENPFEGGANDVPISMLCRTVERELREMLGDANLAPMPDQEANVVL
ncbi:MULTISPECIES: bestrophin family protein [Paraburkholderia]|uniref:bestrophin family protein n=1 Tax=Paraburkholderia TaxID=1822464 RepID=UPI00225C35CB|nr:MULTISPECIES: bestrophin family ion channel [Paraburkholderia]MCX4155026.1 bestrophin family ion channel [Paraburkholderia aspalathi]MDN7164436.1 multidrug transporter [Paraburkholderia sp. SECH2]MDQ6392921.1 multidrug transporter [Paraburkholderia aspalathi]